MREGSDDDDDIAGSRDIFELPGLAVDASARSSRLGNAPGADAQMQGLLAGYNYEHAVFHARMHHATIWATGLLTTSPRQRALKAFSLHAAKGREMSRRADFGLMVGDFARYLPQHHAPCRNRQPLVVYDTLRGTVGTLHGIADWHAMMHLAGADVRREVGAGMTADERIALAT